MTKNTLRAGRKNVISYRFSAFWNLFFLLCVILGMNGTQSFQRNYILSRKSKDWSRTTALRSSQNGIDELKRIMQQSEMFAIVPLDAVSMEGISTLKTFLNSDSITCVITRNKLIELVDGSPYSIIFNAGINSIATTNFCILTKANVGRNYAAFIQWTRLIRKENWDVGATDFDIVVAKKGHLVRINSNSIEAE